MPFFDVFKKKTKNEQKIRDHRTNLFSRYTEYKESNLKINSNLLDIFHHIPDNKSFLCHLATGYDNTYSLFTDYILLKQEIDTQIMPESSWREKTKKADAIILEFKHEFDKLAIEIMRGSEEFEGICEECIRWYDEDDPNTKKLVSKLKAFKMPF